MSPCVWALHSCYPSLSPVLPSPWPLVFSAPAPSADPYLDGWSQETFSNFPAEWWNNQQFGVLLPVCPTPSSPGLTPGVGCSPVGGTNVTRVSSMCVLRGP